VACFSFSGWIMIFQHMTTSKNKKRERLKTYPVIATSSKPCLRGLALRYYGLTARRKFTNCLSPQSLPPRARFLYRALIEGFKPSTSGVRRIVQIVMRGRAIGQVKSFPATCPQFPLATNAPSARPKARARPARSLSPQREGKKKGDKLWD
jgi:hypothetical protein